MTFLRSHGTICMILKQGFAFPLRGKYSYLQIMQQYLFSYNYIDFTGINEEIRLYLYICPRAPRT